MTSSPPAVPTSLLRLLTLLIVGALVVVPASAQQDRGGAGQYEARLPVPPPPNPPRLVNDLAGLLAPSERDALERKLVAFDDSTTTQIAVVIVRTTDGAAPADYALEILRSWGVGRAGADNGVVFLVAVDDRETFIATGLGAEGALTDARAGRIVREVIVPRFRAGLFYAGIDEASDAMMAALAGEDFSEDTLPAQSDGGLGGVMCLLLIVFLMLVILSSRRGGPGSGTPSKSVPGGRRRRGPGVVVIPSFGGGGFGGGGGGFGGGFGGGGFGGFGGGFGGGGGAGGGW